MLKIAVLNHCEAKKQSIRRAINLALTQTLLFSPVKKSSIKNQPLKGATPQKLHSNSSVGDQK